MSGSTKGLDPAFQGAGQKIGTEIWRIENFQPVPLPKSDYGKFYTGDSYIILQTSPGKGGAYLYDIHFWLGKDTSQDEAGTAAIKTVELDASLGGKAVQHRELQGHESDKFLSYFKPCIIPLEGGVASGFKKPEEEEFETRLYVCKGKRAVKVKQVPFARSSLNHDDVFILDTKDKIYQFNGANSNIQERAKALEVIQFLKDTYHEGKCDVAIVDDGKLQAESDSGEFWVLFGGFAPIGRKVASDDDIIPEATPAKLYSVANGQTDPLDGELSKGMLENNKCYLLDCGDEIYLWFGRATQVEERKLACQAAEDFVSSQNRPKATRITRVIQGYESHSFKSHFDSWPAGSVSAGAEEGRGKVAAFLKQQGVGVKGATKGAPANEEVPPLLVAGGKIEVWRINGSAKTSVPKEDIGKFYSGDCYIVLYTYHAGDKKEDYYLCWWIGKDSVEEEQKMAAQLANTMSNSLKGRPVQGRIFQGKEPPQFLALFEPMIVLKGGLSSGYKKLMEQASDDETYTTDGVALFRISGTSVHNSRAVQVDANSSIEVLVRSFQLAFSLRNIALAGGSLPPSRRRSLFTLATAMLIFAAKAYNVISIVSRAKATIQSKSRTVDPFLFLVGDTKLQAVVHKTDKSTASFGSKEDDSSASRYLSEIDISGDQSREALVPIIVQSLESIPSSESGTVTEQLLSEFLPDDVPLGAQLTPNKIYQYDAEKNKSEDEGPLLFAIDEDGLSDSSTHSKEEKQSTTEMPNLLSVDQLLESVSDDQLVRFSISTGPNVSYKEMASHCEALLIGKQEKMTNLIVTQIQESLINFHPENSNVSMAPRATNPFVASDLVTGSNKAPSSSVPMLCAVENQYQTEGFKLPTLSPYDNFLRAASC